MPQWAQAFAWGLLAGSPLLLGAMLGYLLDLSQHLVAAIMSVGAGVLVSALAFELMAEAVELGGLAPTALGFIAGAVLYSTANYLLAKRGATHRKRSRDQQTTESEVEGSGAALALGALLDGVPESIVIGVSLLSGRGVSAVTVAAVFLSNLPEGLSSAAGMKRAGRKARYVFGVWTAIMFASGIASLLGYTLFDHASSAALSVTIGVAAGAILAMLAVTMMPEASAGSHELGGLYTCIGFLAAFALRTFAE
jgi:zinc transporter, ZIP family